MIPNIGSFAEAAVHPTRVQPAASTLDATMKFLSTLDVSRTFDAAPGAHI